MIAVFDSGYGGLTVLKPIMDLMPEYDYLYLGDNARAPYGHHSAENIKRFSGQAVEYLFKAGAVLIIFACNTTSAVALRYIQQQLEPRQRRGKNLPENKRESPKVLGVLIPVAEKAVEITKNDRVGVVGTRATIDSDAYKTEIHKINPGIRVYSKACPLLVPFIEEAWHNKPEAKMILKKYLRPLKHNNIDTLILGCTHYPFMLKNFKKIMGKKVKVLTSGEITAERLKDYLERHPEIENRITKNKKREFLTTDNPGKFKEFTEKHFRIKIKTPKKVELKVES